MLESDVFWEVLILLAVVMFAVTVKCSLSMKVPSIVKEAKKALADGQAVVIGLQTTGEVREKSSDGAG